MDIKKMIGGVAPALATALGGPGAGFAVSALAKFFGCNENEEDIQKAFLTADPSTLTKLKELDYNFKIEAQRLANATYKIDADDRDSARKREIALGGRMNGFLAIFILVGFFGAIGALFSEIIPDENKDVLYLLVGTLGGMATQVVAYFFGSSKGSKDKTLALFK